MEQNPYRLGIEEIKNFLPTRFPFLFVDRILEIHPAGNLDSLIPSDKIGTRVVAIKCVTYNEPYFQGHYPNFSIMPGALTLECMAQVAAFSVYPYKKIESLGGHPVLAGANYLRFRRPIVPGDVLRIETVMTGCRKGLWTFECEITVEGKIVAEAEILASRILKQETVCEQD